MAERVGTVTQVSPRGEIVVAMDGPKGALGPGARLVDARRNRVGRVSDIIGPVSRPFLIVLPPKDRDARPGARRGDQAQRLPRNFLGLLGKELYREP